MKMLTAILILLATSVCQAQVLIANSALSGRDLSRNEARLFFTMRLQYWGDNQPLQVFVLPDNNPEHQHFAKTVLGLFPYQLRTVWDRQLFTGTGQAPVTVGNEQEMLQRVASTPGAIGYLGQAPLDPRIQVIAVY